MSKQSLQNLPQELITLVLEHVCRLIVQDLTMFVFPRRNPYGETLNQYLRLLLVSRCFHRILTHYVRVDGIPIRKKLLDLQMQRLINFLEFGGCSDSGRQIGQILDKCGYVWANPGSRNLILQLFSKEDYQSSEAEVFYIGLLPKMFQKELVKTVDNEEISPRGLARPGDLGSQEKKEDNSEDDPNKEEKPEFEDLVHNKTYRMNTTRVGLETSYSIEFVVGRYQFPFSFPEQSPSFYVSKGEWIGTSILSFKESVAETSWSGEEERYWLWFIPHQIWILIDYVTSIAIDTYGDRFDLKNYGEQVY